MKISLFFKSYIIKAYFFLFIITALAGMPTQANAGFFSDLIGIFSGKDQSAQAYQATDAVPVDGDNKVYNSQTLPLLESSVNPNMKNIKEVQDVTIVEDEALISNNGPLGPAMNLEKYASSEKINVYKVKKGDTIEGIAKKFKISKDIILYSNADLKEKDLLKIGQTLVILAVKDDISKTVIEKEDQKADKQVEKAEKAVSPVPAPVQEIQAPAKSVDIEQPLPQPQPKQAKTEEVVEPTTPTPTGKPEGTITGEYIWPFPEGVGRVSQGLHADQAYDFAAPKGTPLYAIQSGTVLIAHPTGYNGGYGLYVVINFDDGRQAIFGHMSKVIVKAGDVVKQGDVIGYVGSTGHSTGPHVHIGFHGTLANPYIGLKINSRDLQIND